MKPAEMEGKVKTLFQKVKSEGVRPDYREPHQTQYLELSKGDYTLTIRDLGDSRMNYVSIKNNSFQSEEYLYLREDPEYYQTKIDHDSPLKKEFRATVLVQEAYDLFIKGQ